MAKRVTQLRGKPKLDVCWMDKSEIYFKKGPFGFLVETNGRKENHMDYGHIFKINVLGVFVKGF
jgi:hypothetical protein